MNKLQRDFVDMITDKLPHTLSIRTRIYIACQFALESNYGKSRLATDQLNFCGMKRATQRISTRLNVCDNCFATYNSLEDCISDYLLWLAMKGAKQDLSIFILKHYLLSYCPDAGYIGRIDAVYNNYCHNVLHWVFPPQASED